MTRDEIKQRLEQAGYALQRLPKEGPRGHGTHWPAITLTTAEKWVLAVEAEENRELKQRLAEDAHRMKFAVTRDQMAALDEAIDWLLSLKNIPERRVVWLRMFRHPISERYRYPWKYIANIYGLSVRRVRELHDTALDRLVKQERKAA